MSGFRRCAGAQSCWSPATVKRKLSSRRIFEIGHVIQRERPQRLSGVSTVPLVPSRRSQSGRRSSGRALSCWTPRRGLAYSSGSGAAPCAEAVPSGGHVKDVAAPGQSRPLPNVRSGCTDRRLAACFCAEGRDREGDHGSKRKLRGLLCSHDQPVASTARNSAFTLTHLILLQETLRSCEDVDP